MNYGLLAIYLVAAMSFGVSLASHGKETKHNFWVSLLAKAISLMLIWWALGWEFI